MPKSIVLLPMWNSRTDKTTVDIKTVISLQIVRAFRGNYEEMQGSF